MRIRELEVLDLRFPTSRTYAGTDAVHVDPDYSAAYVILTTDEGVEGHGLTFTIGRGNEVWRRRSRPFDIWSSACGWKTSPPTSPVSGAGSPPIRSFAGSVLRRASSISPSPRSSMRSGISTRKSTGKPLWKLLADMTPRQLVRVHRFPLYHRCADPDEAIEMLERQAHTKADREADAVRVGYPAYTTSVGWMGYSDDRIRAAVSRRRSLKGGRISK